MQAIKFAFFLILFSLFFFNSAKSKNIDFNQKKYKKIEIFVKKNLDLFETEKAEKILIKNRIIIEKALDFGIITSNDICNLFHEKYHEKTAYLIKTKNYQQALQNIFEFKKKFTSPQTLFYDYTNSSQPLFINCSAQLTAFDQEIDNYKFFLTTYFKDSGFVIPLIDWIEKSFYQKKYSSESDIILETLKHTSLLIKKERPDTQKALQAYLIVLIRKIMPKDEKNKLFEFLIEQENHYIMLLGQQNKCDSASQEIRKRLKTLKDDKKTLKDLTLSEANDLYEQSFFESAIEQYQHFVQVQLILGTCSKIPKYVFERYFKYLKKNEQ